MPSLIILDELNVKEAEFLDDESGFAQIKAKANFVRLGPRLGPLMKKAAPASPLIFGMSALMMLPSPPR